MSNFQQVKIDQIKVGKRLRSDLGNIDDDMQSIKDVGLINPLLLNQNFDLICGERRLTICKLLGWKTVPCQIISVGSDFDAMKLEIAENTHREDFKSSDKVSIVESLRSFEKGGDRRSKDFLAAKSNSYSKEEACAAVGWKMDKYDDARYIVKYGTKELIRQMDSGELSLHKAAKLTRKHRGEVKRDFSLIGNFYPLSGVKTPTNSKRELAGH